MDPNNWRASFCWARVSPPNEAVEILKTVISRQERDSPWMKDPAHMEDLANLNFELATKYWEVEYYDLAIPVFATSFRQAPRRIDRAMDVLLRYSRAGIWTAITSFIEQMAMVDHKKHLGNMVLEYMSSGVFHEIIRDTAIATKKLGIVDTAYKASIQRGEKRNDHKALLMARFYYGAVLNEQPIRQEEKVIHLWEAALWDDFPSSGMDPDNILPIIYARLGSIYLQRALVARAKADQDSVMDYLGSISGMVPEEVTQSRLLIPPQLYLARFHHVDGNDTKAQQIVRTLVQIALELLSDGDEDHDLDAFIPLDDTKNALAALGLIGLGNRSDNGQGLVYDMDIPCDGECKYIWKMPSELWICKNCIGINLEENCLKKLQECKLERNICNPDHDFLKAPRWDGQRMDSLPKGMVPWGDQNITLDEWKQVIRKAYVDLDA